MNHDDLLRENAALRAWAENEQQKRHKVEEDRLAERSENARLRAELDYAYRCVSSGYNQGVFDFHVLRDRALAHVNQLRDDAGRERTPGHDPKTGKYSTAQMLRDEMSGGDPSQPLFD